MKHKKTKILSGLLVLGLLLGGCSSSTDSGTDDGTGEETNVFTATTLAQYNGLNGAKAYIAVSGVVYDVTGNEAWTGGAHKGIEAGKDVTAAFEGSPHQVDILADLTVVGTYE
ncbi:MAG: cytochrome b5 domain-containing protein [Erysipelotrichaceae bacterium]